jgi:hypothetical protein
VLASHLFHSSTHPDKLPSYQHSVLLLVLLAALILVSLRPNTRRSLKLILAFILVVLLVADAPPLLLPFSS